MTSTTTSPSTSRRGARPKIALCDLTLDERCQARAELHQETVDEYAEYYTNGVKLPAIDVFKVGKKLIVVDGFHRFAAANKAGVEFLRCNTVGAGKIEDAAWHAVSVNQTHGLRRSNADKRQAVLMALWSEIGGEQSSRAIAEHVGVSHDFVSRVRKEWEVGEAEAAAADEETADQVSSDDSSTVIGRDGKRHPKRKTKTSTAKLSSDDNAPVGKVEKLPPPLKTSSVLNDFVDFILALRKAVDLPDELNLQVERLEKDLRAALHTEERAA